MAQAVSVEANQPSFGTGEEGGDKQEKDQEPEQEACGYFVWQKGIFLVD